MLRRSRINCGLKAFDGKSLFERNEYVMARLAADYPRDMTSAGGVLGEHYVAGSETANRAVAGFDLDLSGKRNDILPFGHGVIVA